MVVTARVGVAGTGGAKGGGSVLRRGCRSSGRRLPDAGYVKARVPPEGEISPASGEGEQVVFRSHFIRGFGLPARGCWKYALEAIIKL